MGARSLAGSCDPNLRVRYQSCDSLCSFSLDPAAISISAAGGRLERKENEDSGSIFLKTGVKVSWRCHSEKEERPLVTA